MLQDVRTLPPPPAVSRISSFVKLPAVIVTVPFALALPLKTIVPVTPVAVGFLTTPMITLCPAPVASVPVSSRLKFTVVVDANVTSNPPSMVELVAMITFDASNPEGNTAVKVAAESNVPAIVRSNV